jgi:DNA polymerase III epsilon subunit-like protein
MHLLQNIARCVDYFIFDLEFIGNIQDLNSCQIWEISIYSKTTRQWYTKVVDPNPAMTSFPKPPIDDLPHLTRDFLDAEKARTWDVVLDEIIIWVNEQSRQIPVFISHNTFKADKPIMELETKRYEKLMPLHWLFFDSLNFCRDCVTSQSGNYSLNGLHNLLLGRPIRNAHRAKYDVQACIDILNKITNNEWMLSGPAYPVYATSLRSVRWIGKKAEMVLGNCRVGSLEILLEILRENAFTDKIGFGLSTMDSIQKSLQSIVKNELPLENIQNISQSIVKVFCPMLIQTQSRPHSLLQNQLSLQNPV